jgi:hypothetical protein
MCLRDSPVSNILSAVRGKIHENAETKPAIASVKSRQTQPHVPATGEKAQENGLWLCPDNNPGKNI